MIKKILNLGKKATTGLALMSMVGCATMNTNYQSLPPTQQQQLAKQNIETILKKKCDYKLEIENSYRYNCAKDYCLHGRTVRVTTSGPNATSYNQFQCSTKVLRQGTLDLEEITAVNVENGNVTLEPKLFDDSHEKYDFRMSVDWANKFKQAIAIYQNPIMQQIPTTNESYTLQTNNTPNEFKLPEKPVSNSHKKTGSTLMWLGGAAMGTGGVMVLITDCQKTGSNSTMCTTPYAGAGGITALIGVGLIGVGAYLKYKD